MKFKDVIVAEEKVRLDPKCWTGKKIGNPKTKVKGGVRVNNCVPAESVEEAVNPAQQAAIAIAKKKKAGVEESAPPGAKAERMVKHIKKGYAKDGKLSDKEKSIAYATAWKAHNKGVNESGMPFRGVGGAFNRGDDERHDLDPTDWYFVKDGKMFKVAVYPNQEQEAISRGYSRTREEAKSKAGQQGVAEGSEQQWVVTIDAIDHGVLAPVTVVAGSQEEAKQKAIAGVKASMIKRGYELTVRSVSAKPEQGVAEGSQRVDSLVTDALRIMKGAEASDAVAALKTVLGDREYNSRRGYYNFYVRQLMDMSGQQGMAEGSVEKTATGLKHRGDFPDYPSRKGQQFQSDPDRLNKSETGRLDKAFGVDWIAKNKRKEISGDPTGVSEEYNPEYDDEAGMADNNLETLERAVQGIDDLIQTGDNLPEWCQEKIAVAKSMLVAVWDYMESEENSEEVDPEIDAMFEAMDQLAEEMAAKKGVSADLVWETFEAMDDNILYETAAWRRKEGKSAKGGLNAKGVASYRRENPGSKLQTAVTTKPSKLKPGSKAAKRRKSFCARMGGVKGPMKKPNGKPTRKALALRKWNC
jgi:hypothetical protein